MIDIMYIRRDAVIDLLAETHDREHLLVMTNEQLVMLLAADPDFDDGGEECLNPDEYIN